MKIMFRFVTIFDSLYEYYTGHGPLSEVYLIYTTFRELALLFRLWVDFTLIDIFLC
jgi:hypothetical protein